MSEGQNERRLLKQAEASIEGLAARRMVFAATAFLPRAAWWIRAVIFSLGALLIFGGVSRLVGEPRLVIGIQLWAAALLWTALTAYDVLGRAVRLVLAEDIEPGMPSEAVEDAIRLAERSWILRFRGPISAIIGGVTATLLGPALAITAGALTPVTLLFVIFGSALTVNMVYLPAMTTVLGLLLVRHGAQLFPLDPVNGRVVYGLRRIGRWVVWATATLALVGVAGPFLIPGLGIVALALAVLVFGGAVTASGLQFVLQRTIVARLVEQRRRMTLNELQVEIEALYDARDDLVEEDRDRLEALLMMYEQAAGSTAGSTLWADVLNFAGPLLLPFVGLILGGLNLPYINADTIELLLDLLL